MKRRIAAAVLYAVVSALGPNDATAAMNPIDDDDDEESSPSLFALTDDRAPADKAGRHSNADGSRDESDVSNPLLQRVSRALGAAVDAAWVVRGRSGFTAAAAVLADPHSSIATIHSELTPAAFGAGGDHASLLRVPLGRALTHCRDRGYLKIVVTVDGASVAPLRGWVESRGFQFSRTRWLDGAPAAEFYTDLYRSGSGDHSPRHEAGRAA